MKILAVSDIEPNIALMKLARYEVDRGNEVLLKCQDPVRIYISNVFDRSAGMHHLTNGAEVVEGGRAIHPYAMLRTDIEHLKPYYLLYGLDFSMGYTSRGCIRRCPFCCNWKREGPIRDHAPIEEFLSDLHKKVVILDNNFLASPKWRQNLEFIIDHGLKVNFHQGLDIRLINEENAQLLAEAKVQNYEGTKNTIHFAFDSMDYRASMERGIRLLGEVGMPPSRLCFYMIVGFWGHDIAYDLQRLNILVNLGCEVEPMVHDNASPLQRHLARWCHKVHGYRKERFETYKRLSTMEKAKVREAYKSV